MILNKSSVDRGMFRGQIYQVCPYDRWAIALNALTLYVIPATEATPFTWFYGDCFFFFCCHIFVFICVFLFFSPSSSSCIVLRGQVGLFFNSGNIWKVYVTFKDDLYYVAFCALVLKLTAMRIYIVIILDATFEVTTC